MYTLEEVADLLVGKIFDYRGSYKFELYELYRIRHEDNMIFMKARQCGGYFCTVHGFQVQEDVLQYDEILHQDMLEINKFDICLKSVGNMVLEKL